MLFSIVCAAHGTPLTHNQGLAFPIVSHTKTEDLYFRTACQCQIYYLESVCNIYYVLL